MVLKSPLPDIEFWLGRAGTGKTWGCLAAIAGELMRGSRGEALVLLAPEQATAGLERRLAAWPGLAGGFTRARVLSFHHLAHEAFLATGGEPRRRPNEMARLMLLRRAMARLGNRLEIFRPASGGVGLAQGLDATLLELERYGWRPQDLADSMAAIPSAAGSGKELLARKLADLVLLWGAWREELAAADFDDPADWAGHAAAAIARWDWLDGARLWIDGFASLTAEETTLLEALLGRARHAVIALCADPAIAFGNPRERVGQERLFETTIRTFQQLRERFDELGWTITLRTPPCETPQARFAASPALAHLERAVLDRLDPEPFPDADWTADAPPIELVEAMDRRAELEAVARRVVALCRREAGADGPPPLPWREVAVMARDLEPYEALARDIFARFGIPCFIDRPRHIQGHPLARLLLSALELLRSGWRAEACIHYSKCGLAPLADPDVLARLENLLLTAGVEGRAWRARLERDAEADLWRQVLAPVTGLERRLLAGEPPARALWGLLEAAGAPEAIEQWIASARADGEEDEALLHAQAWDQALEWLETLDRLDGGGGRRLFEPPVGREDLRPLLEELAALAQAALGATRARLTPPTLNQVTVGSVDRSRTPEVQVLFVLGMNEREFPRLWNPDPILGDEERGRLAVGRRRLGPDTRARLLQEHYLAYIALTRPSRRLVLSRPLRAEDGKPTDPSPWFRRVRAAFPLAPLASSGRAGDGDDPALPLRPEEWALRLSSAAEGLDAPGRPAALAALMTAGDPLETPGLEPTQRRALATSRALSGADPCELEPALAAQYWGRRGSLAVTALERFGECPFHFFAATMLGLESRAQWRLGPPELGSLRHDLLETLYNQLNDGRRLDWGGLDLARAGEIIEQRLAELAADPRWRDQLGASELSRLELERLGDEMRMTVAALKTAAALGDFMQVEAERRIEGWSVGAGDLSIRLAGKIDRIDSDGDGNWVLIDYKSGRRRPHLGRMFAGVDLQLLAYGLAWRRMAADSGTAPLIGGIFYWPLTPPTRRAGRIETAAADLPLIDADWFRVCGPAGLFDERIAPLLDAGVAPGSRSLAFGFGRNKDGRLGARGAHWPAGSLGVLLDRVDAQIADSVGEIFNGRIAPAPIWLGPQSNACVHCEFGSLCRRLEQKQIPWRRLANLKREQALELLMPAAPTR